VLQQRFGPHVLCDVVAADGDPELPWPAGAIGSSAHGATRCVAAARAGTLRSLGVDVELEPVGGGRLRPTLVGPAA
jgi:4'-phosphopantetheinyl transferase EntD